MPPSSFFGRHVVAATFVLAVLGWGIGFYGPPIYLQTVVERTGWAVPLVSSAVTLHFLVGAVVVANLPRLHRAIGVPRTTTLGAIVSALGTYGWAVSDTPSQLFLSAVVSGAGWVALGAAAVNALIAPWFIVRRPAALGMAYNGASVGGLVFCPLWVWLIATFGFAQGAAAVGVISVAVIGALSYFVFSRTPEQLHQRPDGDLSSHAPRDVAAAVPHAAPIGTIWTDRRFVTLTAGMALGLFAQIGLFAHLFSLIVPIVGEQQAGLAMGFCTGCAVLGRTVVARAMRPGMDRRRIACLGYLVQAAGALLLLGATRHEAWLWCGLFLFGSGVGNATSLPPLIAQAEFTREDTPRLIALMVALSQATYAFAPAAFGLLRPLHIGGTPGTALFVMAASIQAAALIIFHLGRSKRSEPLDPRGVRVTPPGLPRR